METSNLYLAHSLLSSEKETELVDRKYFTRKKGRDFK